MRFYIDADSEGMDLIIGQLMAKKIKATLELGDESCGVAIEKQVAAFDFVGRFFVGSIQFDVFLEESK